MGSENRESERKGTLNLLDLVVIDEMGKAVNRTMARTLNVSTNGILLETHLDLAEGQLLLVTIGLENDLCEVKGKVVRADKSDDTFSYGIEFVDVEEKNSAVIKKFLDEFNENS